MKSIVAKAAGFCLLSTVLMVGNTMEAWAVNTKGANAVAGASATLEQYFSTTSVATKETLGGDAVMMSRSAFKPVPGYENLGIANVQDSLNIRETPIDGQIVGRLLVDAACEIISEEDGWYYIESGEISGYVSAEYILTGDAALERAWDVMANIATVKADALYLREEPSTESGIVEVLGNSERLEVLEQADGWAKVVVDSTEGYVSMDYIEITSELQTARTLSQIMYGMDVSDLRLEMITFAQQFVGYPYVYGGNSLTRGTDCSGFTNLIYANFGISIPRTATTQYNYGTKISIDELLPGDLIIYGESSIEHVGMYIGNGQIVHASNERTGIKYSQMYYRNIIGCVRMIYE